MKTGSRTGLTTLSLNFSINSIASRLAVVLALVAGSLVFVYVALENFAVGALSSESASVDQSILSESAKVFPTSSRLHARLARVANDEFDYETARHHARLALEYSPYDYRHRLLLASVDESLGDSNAAEADLRAAVAQAPYKAEPRWQLANLLLRIGKRSSSLPEFRACAELNPRLLPVTLHIIWRITEGNLQALNVVTPDDPKSRLALSSFLLKQSYLAEAGAVFSSIDPSSRMSMNESRDFIRSLSLVDVALARDLWIDTVHPGGANNPLIWNGGFEDEVNSRWGLFDWVLDRSEYARIRIASGSAHSGNHALRVDFVGRDTTTLTTEIRQNVALRRGAHYQLTCWARADNLVTTEGPRLAVTTRGKPGWIAQSNAVSAALSGWQQLSIDFVAPDLEQGSQPAFILAIRRKPAFSYDEPTTGTIWFDDFSLVESGK